MSVVAFSSCQRNTIQNNERYIKEDICIDTLQFDDNKVEQIEEVVCPNYFEKKLDEDTLLICRKNDKNKIRYFVANKVFVDTASDILFPIDYMNDEFSLFNLCTNEIVISFKLEHREVLSIYKTNLGYYTVVFLEENNSETVWDIEVDMDRLFLLDITPKEIDGVELGSVSN